MEAPFARGSIPPFCSRTIPSVFDPKEVRYREEKLQGLMELGLDTWWYDRNWHTKLNSPSKRVLPETFGLYLFEEITKHFYEKKGLKTF